MMKVAAHFKDRKGFTQTMYIPFPAPQSFFFPVYTRVSLYAEDPSTPAVEKAEFRLVNFTDISDELCLAEYHEV